MPVLEKWITYSLALLQKTKSDNQRESLRCALELSYLAIHRVLCYNIPSLQGAEAQRQAARIKKLMQGFYDLDNPTGSFSLIRPSNALNCLLDSLRHYKISDAYPVAQETVIQFIDTFITISSLHWDKNNWHHACGYGDTLAVYIINHNPPFASMPAKYRNRRGSEGNQVTELDSTEALAQAVSMNILQTEIPHEEATILPAGRCASPQQASKPTPAGFSNDQPLVTPALTLVSIAQAGGETGLATPCRVQSDAVPALAQSSSVHSLGTRQQSPLTPPLLEVELSRGDSTRA